MSLVYILAAIFIFGVLIAVHELGHFLAAKLCGVQVNEFSIGMGPAVWHRKKGETPYSLRGLPHRRLLRHGGRGRRTPGNARAFTRQGFWKKFVILAAGAGMNFLTGLRDRGDPVQQCRDLLCGRDHRPCPGGVPDRGKRSTWPGIRSIRSTAGAPISAATPRCF